MARPRKRSKTREAEGDAEVSSNTKSEAQPATVSADQQMMMSAVGFTKPTSYYNVSTKYQSPPIALRRVIPFAALFGGFRAASGDSASDTTLLMGNSIGPLGVDGDGFLNVETHPYTSLGSYALEAATPMAETYVRQVWPYYDRLFRSSVKTATTNVTFNHFTAVLATLMRIQARMLEVKTVVALGSPIGVPLWDEISHVWGYNHRVYARATLNRIVQMESLINGLPCIAGMAGEVRRMMSPFIATQGGGTITVPTFEHDHNAASDNFTFVLDQLDAIEGLLDILRGDYANELATMKMHMPYKFGDMDALNPAPITVDPFRSDGFMNSDFSYINVSGNESDYSYVMHVTIDEDVDDEIGFLPSVYTPLNLPFDTNNQFFTVMSDGIPLLSVLSGSLWVADDDLIDNEFALVTPHIVADAAIPYYNYNTSADILTYKIGNATQEQLTLPASHAHLVKPLLAEAFIVSPTNYIMPDTHAVNIDFEVVVEGLRWYTTKLFDVTVVEAIDTLAQTSHATVTHPAVAAVRSAP